MTTEPKRGLLPAWKRSRRQTKMLQDVVAWMATRRAYDEDPEYRARTDALRQKVRGEPDGG